MTRGLDTQRYISAVCHAEELVDELAKPEQDWRLIDAHADALKALARIEQVSAGSAAGIDARPA